MSHTSRIRRAGATIAAVAIAAGLATATSVGSAVAAPPATGARLMVYAPDTSNIRVTIEGVFPMSRIDADTVIKYMNDQRAGGVTYTLRADDPGANDAVVFERYVTGTGTMPGGHLLATDEGLHYLKIMLVPREYMDEDHNPFDDTDEIYAQVHLNYAQGGDRYATSPVVARNY
ncbi:hypothetical protein [Gordonia rhizosphera]|uniref:Uncharacterized protein n=1 Tax=Gordonia rhizosphera NBRC 16068 TaxID=1108045 RepID=K6VR80_9ACTN|nr:hypothetical protein [Gordonia rhizosphera]GAB89400.1 hypothetical protein GORHZ_060_00320 [Gordonia rhizosphera NBRC 16068]